MKRGIKGEWEREGRKVKKYDDNDDKEGEEEKRGDKEIEGQEERERR